VGKPPRETEPDNVQAVQRRHGRPMRVTGLPVDIMATRRARVAMVSKALGKGNNMSKVEITFSRSVDYSLVLDDRKKRELADHLDITVRELDKLVAKEMLFELHDSRMIEWIELQRKAWDELSKADIEVDQILAE